MINALCSFFGPFSEGNLSFQKWVPSLNDGSLSMMRKSNWHNLLLHSSLPVWIWVLTGWGEHYSVIKMTFQVCSMPLQNLFYLSFTWTWKHKDATCLRSQRKNWPLATSVCHSYHKGSLLCSPAGNIRAWLGFKCKACVLYGINLTCAYVNIQRGLSIHHCPAILFHICTFFIHECMA